MPGPAFRRIDVHAHANFKDYAGDTDAVIHRALDAGTAMINVGVDLATSREVVALADAHPRGVYAIVGQHPTDTDDAFDPAPYRELLRHQKVVAIGECGLDYFHEKDPAKRELQMQTFLAQIRLANEFQKPLMLHIRDAYADAREILRAHARVKGNSHFFAGTVDDARQFLDMGYTMSFTGAITFAKQYRELVEYVPLDMMHAETDCPFVAPVPHRGTRNEPAYVSYVYEKIAEIKKVPLEEVERALRANAERMFGILLG
jgi:TatD DNase family protein